MYTLGECIFVSCWSLSKLMRPQAKAQAKGDIIPLSLGFMLFLPQYRSKPPTKGGQGLHHGWTILICPMRHILANTSPRFRGLVCSIGALLLALCVMLQHHHHKAQDGRMIVLDLLWCLIQLSQMNQTSTWWILLSCPHDESQGHESQGRTD